MKINGYNPHKLTGTFTTALAIASMSFSALSFATSFSGGAQGVTASSLPANTTSIKVSSPAGKTYESSSSFIQPGANENFADGVYTFEVTAILQNATPVNEANNGRNANAAPQQLPQGVVESGSFSILKGNVVNSNLKESE